MISARCSHDRSKIAHTHPLSIMPISSNKDNHRVSNILHTLRGEQFRRAQNAKGSRTHLSLTSLSSNSTSGNRGLPSLPKDISKLDYDTDPTEAFRSLRLGPANPTRSQFPPLAGARYAGPKPPKSWRRVSGRETYETPEWRAEALSLVFSCITTTATTTVPDGGSRLTVEGQATSQSRVPSLALVCLRRLLSLTSSSEFAETVVPYLPPHLRRDLMRDATVHSPLPGSMLFSLCGKEGHVAGELIVVGPAASLPEAYFSRDGSLERGKGQSDWDEEGDTTEFLNTFVLMSARLASSTLLRLPATIVNMALVHLPDPISLHRLPIVCPLLETLDLSYNGRMGSLDLSAGTGL
ncbi:hypothetical protein AX15_001087 [Amanita polypyramis BW_CC]|nr:hypothetical protein AX15_001087 [Amanita polypyramis BW_CC]